MHYTFPHITNISEIYPIIEGKDEFIVAERGPFLIVNYMVNMPDTFPPIGMVGLTNGDIEHDGIPETLDDYAATVLRELRGMVFYADTGEVAARRYHKFFNVNERDETQMHLIDISLPHVILEKLDGSMITPLIFDDTVHWGTKMGHATETAERASLFVKRYQQTHSIPKLQAMASVHPWYSDFAYDLHQSKLTPIFEWLSNSDKIVIDHPVDNMVLTAIRHQNTGKYHTHGGMHTLADPYNIPVIKLVEGTVENMQEFLDDARDLEGTEGYVIRFDDGHMLKIKGEWYVQLHRTKDIISSNRKLVELIVNENLDDAKAFILPEDLQMVDDFERMFWKGFNLSVAKLASDMLYFHRTYSRKEFAMADLELEFDKGLYFKMWDFARDPREIFMAYVERHLSKNVKYDLIKHYWENDDGQT